MVSKSSFSVYLKPGVNNIITSEVFENRDAGYSVMPIFGEGKITVTEDNKLSVAEGIFY